MLDLIRIRREGYPVHIDFDSFVTSYKCLCKGVLFPTSAKEKVFVILNCLKQPTNQWQVRKKFTVKSWLPSWLFGRSI